MTHSKRGISAVTVVSLRIETAPGPGQTGLTVIQDISQLSGHMSLGSFYILDSYSFLYVCT